MNLTARLFVIVIAILIAAYIYTRTRKKLFSEKESIAWMLFSLLVIIISIFPVILNKLSLLVGIQYPPSFLFMLAIIFLLCVIFHQSQTLSVLSERTKELAQNVALLDERIRQMESAASKRQQNKP